jgi:tyrosine-protein phosphatase YwqE
MFAPLRHSAPKNEDRSCSTAPLSVDVNAHVLPGLDNGADTEAEGLRLLARMQEMGYRKVIATPHVMQAFYPLTPEVIRAKLERMQQLAYAHGLRVSLEAAAQYYLDEGFLALLRQRQPLLCLLPRVGSSRYVLFETAFVTLPAKLLEAVDHLVKQGYTPVMAHPERCLYLQKDLTLVHELHRRNVLFQVDANSLTGYYSRNAQRMAERLIEENLVYFLGSDCHRLDQLEVLDVAAEQPHYRQAIALGLLNNTLL